MSGQGPYWGVAGWFNTLHPEKLPSAIKRYNEQVRRVLGVLDGWLEGKQWLVGDEMTYTNLAWVPWNDRLDGTIGVVLEEKFTGFPNVKAWHECMTSRPSWINSMETRATLIDEQGLMWNGVPKGMASFQEYEAKIATGEDTAKV
ncbi:glutathione S-transferase [Mycena olivaceomarginata]|nr:glutathione S-transferase [Mycena olivaceomarginata]